MDEFGDGAKRRIPVAFASAIASVMVTVSASPELVLASALAGGAARFVIARLGLAGIPSQGCHISGDPGTVIGLAPGPVSVGYSARGVGAWSIHT